MSEPCDHKHEYSDFCGRCGADLRPLRRTCPKCATRVLSTTNKFCVFCGAKLVAAPEKATEGA